eukprot:Opistho-2@45258
MAVEKAKEAAVATEGEKKPADTKKKDDKKKKLEELSEEDKQLKEELELLVERLKDADASLHKPALEALRTHIRSSTSSMTSVPKPLKFLRGHYGTMKDLHGKMPDGENKKFLADVLSVVAMTAQEDGKRECLGYCLAGSGDALGSWGHEYVKHLAGEISGLYDERVDTKQSVDDLTKLVMEIVPFDMKHNAEAEACDLLAEIERLDILEQFVDEDAHPRVCLYLTSCVDYVQSPENTQLLKTALGIFRKFNRYPEALRIATQLGDRDLVKQIFDSCPDRTVQNQLALMLGRQQLYIQSESESLNEWMANSHLSPQFLALARELDIVEAKVPEDIYKSHLEPTRSTFGASVDSARQNLASTFVNAFVNAGFGNDKLMTEEGNKWLYKNKDHGMMSAAASLGMILLWDVDGGLSQIDRFLYLTEDYIKAGALLACGLVNTGIRHDCDPALALLSDYVHHKSGIMRVGAIIGLGLAYSGSARDDIIEHMLPVLGDSNASMELVGVTALSLGLIAVGTCHAEITSTILQTIMEKSDAQLKDPYARFLALGLALLYLGKQEAAEVTLATLQAVSPTIGRLAGLLVDACAYAGTGNVLKVQSMLHECSDHFDKEKEQDDTHQAFAVLGIALIAMGEEIGAEMSLRSFNHLLQYGEPVIRRNVPLALAMLCPSNPKLNVLDTLSKLSHDPDAEVAHNSILALGIVGAGTNNARIATMLRQLAAFYYKDSNNLFMVRIAQGLLHMGKGTMTLNPYHSDRGIMSNVAVAGLLSVLVACTDIKSTILGKSHYLLYYLTPAMCPRMFVTFDESMKSVPVTVRVGQAVDVVGQAGRPKSITGFQTHTTPVLLGYGERAELATEEFESVTPILEGFVIVKKNKDYVAPVKDEEEQVSHRVEMSDMLE